MASLVKLAAAASNNSELQVQGTGTHLAFSSVRLQKLDETSYTLVTLVLDVTGSLSGFEKQIREAVKTVVDSCKKHGRKDMILIRILAFSTSYGMVELTGFMPVLQVDPSSFDFLNTLQCSGMTNLYDATYNALAATRVFAKQLSDQEFPVNALIVVATDGGNTERNGMSVQDVAAEMRNLTQKEICESCLSILIGLNAQNCSQELSDFNKDAGFTQYEPLNNLNADKFARMADFISRSISAQSQALTTGQASAPLTL